MIFNIAGMDISSHIVVGSYDVNLHDLYNEWKDGNKRKHRDIIGQQAKGKCTLHFSTVEEYKTFVHHMKVSRNLFGGYYPCSIKVNDDDSQSYQGNFYIEFDTKLSDNAMSIEKVEDFDLEIEER